MSIKNCLSQNSPGQLKKTLRAKTCGKTKPLSYRLYVFFPLLYNMGTEIVLNIKEETILQWQL
jgi:hypothetical protein